MNIIKNMRKKKHLTQTAMAEKLRVESSTVSKWETGVCLPRAELLPKLAELLGCTTDELLSDTHDKPTKSA